MYGGSQDVLSLNNFFCMGISLTVTYWASDFTVFDYFYKLRKLDGETWICISYMM